MRKAIRKKQKFNDLAKQVLKKNITLTVTTKDLEKDFVNEFKGLSYIETMSRLSKDFEESQLDKYEKCEDDCWIIYKFELEENITKSDYNKLTYLSSLNKYDLVDDTIRNDIQDTFLETFFAINERGEEKELEFLKLNEQINLISIFLQHFEKALKNLKKK